MLANKVEEEWRDGSKGSRRGKEGSWAKRVVGK